MCLDSLALIAKCCAVAWWWSNTNITIHPNCQMCCMSHLSQSLNLVFISNNILYTSNTQAIPQDTLFWEKRFARKGDKVEAWFPLQLLTKMAKLPKDSKVTWTPLVRQNLTWSEGQTNLKFPYFHYGGSKFTLQYIHLRDFCANGAPKINWPMTMGETVVTKT